jgi:hypothetical protein
MDSTELRNLHEAYLDVYAPQEIDEAVKGESGERRKDLAAERRSGIKPLSAKEGEGYASHKLSQMSYVKRKRMGEAVEGLDEIDSSIIARTAHKRMQNLDAAQKKEMGARDAGASAEEQSKRGAETSAAAAKVSKHRALSTAHARSRSRMNKEEVEQIDELSVNKMHDYINKAEKDRDRLNKKWDQGTATSKERKKVFDREEGESRASEKIRQKTGKDSFRLNALDKLKSAITKESYDLFDAILEYLVAEGYADTNESALVIMANMSEEWRRSIVEGDNYDKNRKRAAQRAAERNAARDAGKTGNVPGVGYVTPRRERETYVDAAGTTRHKSGAKMP